MTSRTRKAALPSQGAVAMRLTQELRGHLTFLCSQRTREKSKHQSSLTAIVRNSIVGVATFFGVSHSMREVLEEDMRRLGILDVESYYLELLTQRAISLSQQTTPAPSQAPEAPLPTPDPPSRRDGVRYGTPPERRKP